MMMMMMMFSWYRGGLTNTLAAVTSIHDELTTRGRHGVNWIGVLITNRPSTNTPATLAAARKARAAGITLIAVGVGETSRSEEMAGIVSWPTSQNWINATDYDHLSAVKAALTQALCNSLYTTFTATSTTVV